MSDVKAFQVRLPAGLYRRLKLRSVDAGVPMSELVRRGVERELEFNRLVEVGTAGVMAAVNEWDDHQAHIEARRQSRVVQGGESGHREEPAEQFTNVALHPAEIVEGASRSGSAESRLRSGETSASGSSPGPSCSDDQTVCAHPKAQEFVKPYGAFCGVCGRRLR